MAANEPRTAGEREITLNQLMSTQALADYLDVPVKSIYEWRLRGCGPPAARVGRHLRWRVEDVERWLDARTT